MAQLTQIIWTNPALDQLNDLAEYIALNNPLAAKKLVATIFDSVKHLEQFPLSGRKIPEFSSPSYRELIVNPCRIFYKIDSSKVYIVHIMRQEQQLKRYTIDS
ncbi:type II toxin-antitoxin system RelE/ParE family toxin [Pelagibaculum spongiae]|uniref:Plasmid stabilization protein n=1 Tax=Pelagibaculum spongiae TaxID=2080658 RepID=A0A2V1H3T9_9GAMM|nr:type II toxin-antitoxin system RelE/ParE family toxin [Pelagibaculum spongiae]PVZ70306.1 plasmid stabilization protein [Pelagibaculum spongiae]